MIVITTKRFTVFNLRHQREHARAITAQTERALDKGEVCN